MQSTTEKISLKIRTLCYAKPYTNFNFSKYSRQQLLIRETVTGNWPFVRITLFTCHRNLERRRPISGVNKNPVACQIRPSTNFKPIHDNTLILQQIYKYWVFVVYPTLHHLIHRNGHSKWKFTSTSAQWENLKSRKISDVGNIQAVVMFTL